MTARAIAREHLFGATVTAYGAGAASVRPWTPADFSRTRLDTALDDEPVARSDDSVAEGSA